MSTNSMEFKIEFIIQYLAHKAANGVIITDEVADDAAEAAEAAWQIMKHRGGFGRHA